MKIENGIILSVIFTACLAISSGCVVESTDTNDNENGDADSFERPEEARTMISDEQLSELEEFGAVIYGGSTPPDVAGSYNRDKPYNFYHTDDRRLGGTNNCTSIVTLEAGNESHMYTWSEVNTGCDGGNDGMGSYISGEDGCFTLYTETQGHFEDCEMEWVRILSGCIDESGILDPQFIFLPTSMEGDSCQDRVDRAHLTGVGQVLIETQEDGIAARVEE